MQCRRHSASIIAGLAAICCSAAQANQAPATLKSLYQFHGGGDGLLPWGGLVYNGVLLYGTTYDGGAYGRGTVFSVDPTTGAETLVYSFKAGGDAISPQAGLLSAGGMLYGTSNQGGANGYGAIFAVNPSTGAEKLVYSFTPAIGGGSGSNLVEVGGYLYGTTFGGGTGAGYGAVFKVNIITGAETTLYSFTGGADGASPQYGVAYAGGVLYGTTTGGGAHGAGTVFAVNAGTGAEKTLFTFDGAAHGGGAYGGVIYAGGVLYGTASYGGSIGAGVVFSYDVRTGTEKTVYNFASGADGAGPQSALIDVGGTLYGTTFTAGVSGYGTVFSLHPASGAITTLYALPGGPNGGHSVTPLIEAGGVLYGTDLGNESGSPDCGSVFKVVIGTKAVTTLHEFIGASPFGPGNSALLDVGGALYGATGSGGAAFAGTIYRIDPSTGGQNTLYSFAGAADGGGPVGAPVADGGALYGVTSYGGANQGGVIYSFSPTTGAQTVVYNFPGSPGASHPNGPLVLVGGVLYGTIEVGGSNGAGTVFAFNPIKKTFDTIYDFTGGSDGGLPFSGLTASGGKLYGTTYAGGTAFAGNVYSIDIATGSETVLYNFTGGADGRYPIAAPIDVGGMLYGETQYGGAQTADCFGGFGCGVLYGIDLTTGSFTTLHTFNYLGDGASPDASLLAVGKTLYGITGVGGSTALGTIFSYVPASNSFNTLYTFTGGADGAFPGAPLIRVGTDLLGTTGGGGAFNTGAVFSLTP